MRLSYNDHGTERTTDNVYIDWPDGICWLVANEFGVVGAIIAHEDSTWEHAYEIALDELAPDIDTDQFDEHELEEMIEDGTASVRGGIPENDKLDSLFADTQYLTVMRARGSNLRRWVAPV